TSAPSSWGQEYLATEMTKGRSLENLMRELAPQPRDEAPSRRLRPSTSIGSRSCGHRQQCPLPSGSSLPADMEQFGCQTDDRAGISGCCPPGIRRPWVVQAP